MCNQSTCSELTTTLKFTKVVLSVLLAVHRGLCRIFHHLQHCATVCISHSFHRCIFDCAVVSCLAFSVDPPSHTHTHTHTHIAHYLAPGCHGKYYDECHIVVVIHINLCPIYTIQPVDNRLYRVNGVLQSPLYCVR